MRGLRLFQEIGEQPACLIRGRRRAESGARSFLRIRRQGELRYEEEATRDVAQRQIHPALGIWKDAVGQEALEQAVDRFRLITTPYADEREDAALDCADHVAIYAHVRTGYTLNEPYHVRYFITGPACHFQPMHYVAFAGTSP